jgi:hypothetical protein
MKQEIRAGQEHIKEIMEKQFGSLAAKNICRLTKKRSKP